MIQTQILPLPVPTVELQALLSDLVLEEVEQRRIVLWTSLTADLPVLDQLKLLMHVMIAERLAVVLGFVMVLLGPRLSLLLVLPMADLNVRHLLKLQSLALIV